MFYQKYICFHYLIFNGEQSELVSIIFLKDIQYAKSLGSNGIHIR